MDFVKTRFVVLHIFLSFLLVSCSDSDTSAEVSENGIADTQDIRVSFSSKEVEVGEELTISYVVDDGQRNKRVPATIHWGDITDDRLSANQSSISHIYRQDGTFNISIQPDGGEKVRVGTVKVNEVQQPAASSQSPAVTLSANLDTISIQAGVSGMLNVLTNDTGVGLTLISVTSTTVSVTPFDAMGNVRIGATVAPGTYNVNYVIQDSSANTANGTITVTVTL